MKEPIFESLVSRLYNIEVNKDRWRVIRKADNRTTLFSTDLKEYALIKFLWRCSRYKFNKICNNKFKGYPCVEIRGK